MVVVRVCVKQEYSTTLYLRQVWRDERLSFAGLDGQQPTPELDHFLKPNPTHHRHSNKKTIK